MIYVVNYNFTCNDPNDIVINTTSRSQDIGLSFSPFLLGPVKIYKHLISQNVENAWQYAKVYKNHVDDNKNPTEEYWSWAIKGWSDSYAHRYPMGKGVKPLYSYWDGEKLGYIDARKKIYIPIYASAVKKYAADALNFITDQAKIKNVYLKDFDGYNFRELGMTYDDVIHNDNKTMGHAFIVAMLVEGYYK